MTFSMYCFCFYCYCSVHGNSVVLQWDNNVLMILYSEKNRITPGVLKNNLRLGIELRALNILDFCSTTWATSQLYLSTEHWSKKYLFCILKLITYIIYYKIVNTLITLLWYVVYIYLVLTICSPHVGFKTQDIT